MCAWPEWCFGKEIFKTKKWISTVLIYAHLTVAQSRVLLLKFGPVTINVLNLSLVLVDDSV